jgi:hypothetical protein
MLVSRASVRASRLLIRAGSALNSRPLPTLTAPSPLYQPPHGPLQSRCPV